MILDRWALYFSPDRVHAFRKSGLGYKFAGSYDEDQVAEFEALVGSIGHSPIDILVDWVEENFIPDAIPHVWGRDRQRLLQRKQDQVNRNTEFRQAVFLGREGQGRKDDRYLFMGLTNPDRFKPWLPLLVQHHAAIRGIYSVSQFIPALAHKVGTPSDHALLTTLSFGTQVRQSYLQADQLQFSRQFLLPDADPERLAAQVAAETEKTRTYLNTKRLMPRDDALDVFILADQALHPLLAARCQDTPLVRYHFLALEDIRPRLGLPADAGGGESLFLALLKHRRPPTSYAQAGTTLFYRYWQAGVAIFLLGLATLAGAAVMTGLNLKAADAQRRLAEQWTREAGDLNRQAATTRGGIPTADLSPEEVIQRGKIQESLEVLAASPRKEMQQLGAILAGHPLIQLHKLEWEGSAAVAGTAPTPGSPPADADKQTLAGVFPAPGNPAALHVEGEVWPFSGDYGAAVGTIDRLVAELARADVNATVLTHPVNLDTRKGTRGSVTAKPGERANFKLRLIFPAIPKHPAGGQAS
jgi:hypothetical protein